MNDKEKIQLTLSIIGELEDATRWNKTKILEVVEGTNWDEYTYAELIDKMNSNYASQTELLILLQFRGIEYIKKILEGVEK